MFNTIKISPHINRITTDFGVCVYLIIGTDKVLLIDTGYGYGSLKSYIRKHTSLPIDVVVTHGHADHIGGTSEFSRVYLNEKDLPLLPAHTDRSFRKKLMEQKSRVDVDNLMPGKISGYLNLKDGTLFEIGGVSVRMIEVPGHTQGCMAAYVIEDDTWIIGDAAGENTMLMFPESTDITTYRNSLMKIFNYPGAKFEKPLLRFHGSCSSDKKLITDLIELCSRIILKEDAHISQQIMGYQCYLAKDQDDHSHIGNIIYK